MFFFFQAEDGIRDLVRSRGLGDVYKRQAHGDVLAGVITDMGEISAQAVVLATGTYLGGRVHLSLIHI